MSASNDPVHVRTLTMQAHRVGDATLEVSGRLVDERPQGPGVGWFGAAHGSVIHDMRVTLRVRHPDLVIVGVVAEMASRPYTLCTDAVEPLSALSASLRRTDRSPRRPATARHAPARGTAPRAARRACPRARP